MNKLSNIEKKILTDSKENSEGRIRGRRKTKVSRLKAGSPVSYLEVLVLRRYPPRVVSNRNWTGRVAAACGRDESGALVWNAANMDFTCHDIRTITARPGRLHGWLNTRGDGWRIRGWRLCWVHTWHIRRHDLKKWKYPSYMLIRVLLSAIWNMSLSRQNTKNDRLLMVGP